MKRLTDIESRPHNIHFAKAGLTCFYDSEVLNSSFVHLMKFSAENPRLRKAAKRWVQFETTTKLENEQIRTTFWNSKVV
jgi:hypothetical protein